MSPNPKIIAIIFQEGGRLLTELIRNRSHKRGPITPGAKEAVLLEKTEEQVTEAKATSVETGCVPCAIGHFGTCSGLLNEAMRFAKKKGIESSEVIDRINMCMDEFNTMERVDLRPEMIVPLIPWEKELAEKALSVSRSTRHSLEGISSVNQLEKIAATTQSTRQEIGRDYFKKRLAKMPKEEKEKLAQKAIEKLVEE